MQSSDSYVECSKPIIDNIFLELSVCLVVSHFLIWFWLIARVKYISEYRQMGNRNHLLISIAVYFGAL